MNRQQIKRRREMHEAQIDRLMSRGYAGSDDPAFKMACEQCKIIERELKKLADASEEINRKSRVTRWLNSKEWYAPKKEKHL